MSLLDTFTLVAFPYVAVFVFAIGTFQRYRKKGFTVSSLSSQFLEGRTLFWGSIPFHFGILALFFGHLIALLIPRAVLAWNGQPLRMLILEVSGLGFGLATLIGLSALVVRRLTNPRIRAVTTKMDVAIELLLLGQVILGVWIAVGFRWGSSWFAATLTPYLWSLAAFSPDISDLTGMSWVIKLHVIGAFAILFMIPFTRLVHMIVAPLNYLVRPYQQVIWNWNRRKVRAVEGGWAQAAGQSGTHGQS
ncbi:MAG: respiratory nitrate reductase subunit gamma [Gemmatimonadota bacterium]